VLFSEPKIPQCGVNIDSLDRQECFSALQRAENSSIQRCIALTLPQPRFSALQRAENSSMRYGWTLDNTSDGFSALQRAENSSIRSDGARVQTTQPKVSVLFSEPKIPQ